MPKENALGPNGFIGTFYSKCWEIVKSELFQAVCQLSQLRGSTFNLLNTTSIMLLSKKDQAEKLRLQTHQSCSQLRESTFNLLNTTNIMLLPKKDQAEKIATSDPSIFSKILASSLAPRLPEMVSSNKSAFVKKRCIYNNFVLIQSIIKELHRKKNRPYSSS
jgi:hypothetical protein